MHWLWTTFWHWCFLKVEQNTMAKFRQYAWFSSILHCPPMIYVCSGIRQVENQRATPIELSEVFNSARGPCKYQLGQLEQMWDPMSSQLRSALRLCHTDTVGAALCNSVAMSGNHAASPLLEFILSLLCHLIGFWYSVLLYRDWCASARMNLSGMLAAMHDLWLGTWRSQ